jgi:hypothetical protein
MDTLIQPKHDFVLSELPLCNTQSTSHYRFAFYMHLIQSVQQLPKLWPYKTTDIDSCSHIIQQFNITLVTDAHDFFK